MKNELPKRKNTRLTDFDYSESCAYFITQCTYNRQCLFNIENTVGNDLCVVPCVQNQIIHKWIKETENKFDNIKFDEFVIMPDHLHFIIRITERHAGRSLQDIMRFFKTMTTNDYITAVKNNLLPPFFKKLWQKSYYDHIIRNEQDYIETINYIKNNPLKYNTPTD